MRLCLLLWILTLSFVVSAQPAITGFSPTSGPVGATVTINGTNFSATSGDNIVYFGAVKAIVTNASVNSLTTIVPAGASYKPISITINNLTAYASQPFIPSFNGCSNFSANSFTPPVNLQVLSSSYIIKLQDVDNDGKPDIIIPDHINGLSVCRNTGSPGNIAFSPMLGVDAANRPVFMDVADFDGDGKVDIAATYNIPDFIGIYRNTSTPGVISFTNAGTYPLSIKAGLGIHTEDFDGDGKPDIVVTSPGVPDQVYVFRNTSVPGSISFVQISSLDASPLPYNMASCDLDGDHKPELIVINADNASVSLFRNASMQGNISFDTRIDLPALSSPRGVVCGDLDGDGHQDIVVSDAQANQLSIYFNNSSPGNLSFLPQMNIATGNYVQNIELADLNGDGKPDLVARNVFSGEIGVYLNTSTRGTILFAAPVNFPTGSSTLPVAAGDVDGDGKQDMVTYGYNSLAVFRNLINTGPAVNATVSTATCNLNNGSIMASGNGDSLPLEYSLTDSNFQSSGNFDSLSANAYLVTIKDANGCTDTTTVVIKQTGNPSIAAMAANAKCMVNDGSISASATGGVNPYLFSIDTINYQPGNSFNNLGPGNYTLTVKDAAGCTDDTTVTIINVCVSLTANAVADTCHTMKGQITARGSGGIAPYKYSIDGSGFQDSGVFPNLTAGTYTVIVKDAQNAKDTVQVMVDNIGLPVTVNAGADVAICAGEQIKLHGITDGTVYSWSPVNTITDPLVTNPFVSPPGTVTYVLNASNGVCSGSDSVTVFVNPVPRVFAGNDTTAMINEPTRLMAVDLDNIGAVSYSWSPATGLDNTTVSNPVAVLTADITYTVKLTSAAGCTATDGIYIKVSKGPEIYVPNAFTPNGDGLNDAFKANPVGLSRFVMLQVYNRWGQLVFSTADPKQGWNGSFKGSPQPVGVYIWTATGLLPNGRTIKKTGTASLLR